MPLQFFSRSEGGPPFLLGLIVDVLRPRSHLALVVLSGNGKRQLLPLAGLSLGQRKEAEWLCQSLTSRECKPVPLEASLSHANRRRAIC